MYVDKKTGLPNRDRVDAMMARLEKQGLLPLSLIHISMCIRDRLVPGPF